MRRAEVAEPEPTRLRAAGPGSYLLEGRLVFGTAARLLAEGEAAFAGERGVVVDLSGVTRADSAGLALLLEWSLTARSAGREIRYRNLPAEITALATLAEVRTLLE
ncbi:MAG: STAS domain-containing protein [Gammaproteobacteria bacterium]|nr:MAG: STAS domain-containing protein [Gammaproteobacteria bacterium]